MCSLAYTDVIVGVGSILWGDVAFPGTEPVAALDRQLARSIDKLASLDGLVGAESGLLFGGTTPGVADFFVYEGFDALRYVLAGPTAEALRRRLPALDAHRRRMLDDPGLRHPHDRPARFTTRPDEDAVVATLHERDFSAAITGRG